MGKRRRLEPVRFHCGMDEFEAKYKEIYKPEEGGFGSVYAALRRSDHLPVAIKNISKADVDYSLLVLNGGVLNVPKEVLLMLKASGGPHTLGQYPTVSLLDWYDQTEEVLLVMERPLPMVDPHTYLCSQNRPLTAGEAKMFLRPQNTLFHKPPPLPRTPAHSRRH